MTPILKPPVHVLRHCYTDSLGEHSEAVEEGEALPFGCCSFSEALFKWKRPRKRSPYCHSGPSTTLGTEWALNKLKRSKWKDV